MRRRTTSGLRIAIMVATAASLTACAPLSPLERDAVRAFDGIIGLRPLEEYEESRWRFSATDGGAVFSFDNMMVNMDVDMAPFIAAGADPSKLGNTCTDTLFYHAESLCFSSPAFDMLNQNVRKTALEQFEINAPYLSEYLFLDSDAGRYGIDFDAVATFEWAEDAQASDRDVVFALDAAPLVAAGANPEAVEGWIYERAGTKDGTNGEAYQFVKPLDLD